MSKPSDSIAIRSLRWLARAVCARPRLFLYPQILIFLFGVGFTIKKLQFDTSRNDLVGSDKEYHQNFLKFKKEFPTQDDLVVVVESELMEKNRQFVERLGARLEAETNLFADVFYKGDLKMLGPKALLFVPENDLKELQKTLQDFRPFIEQFTQATNLNSLFALVNRRFRTARQEQNAENDALIKAMPALERIIVQAAQSLKRPGSAPSPGLNALFGAGDEAERASYITFAKGRIYLVTTRAVTDELNGKAVERLRELVQQTQFEVPGLNVGITGEPVLEHDEMAQSQFDSTVASIVSLVACALIFIFGYNQTGRPLKATLCLVVGLGYTMFYTTLVVGHLNILTITFVPILVGLAIDFGVHLITRYEEELRHGKSQNEAMELAMVNTGIGIFTGAFTTAGAFFAMALTNFKGIQEMGVICGGGMLLCLVPMMTLLPVLLLRGRQNVIDTGAASSLDRRAKIENFWLRRPVLVVAVTV
ncbi:MAG: MMPL family transporter, partial [Verrucomicrobiota bacterium]